MFYPAPNERFSCYAHLGFLDQAALLGLLVRRDERLEFLDSDLDSFPLRVRPVAMVDFCISTADFGTITNFQDARELPIYVSRRM